MNSDTSLLQRQHSNSRPSSTVSSLSASSQSRPQSPNRFDPPPRIVSPLSVADMSPRTPSPSPYQPFPEEQPLRTVTKSDNVPLMAPKPRKKNLLIQNTDELLEFAMPNSSNSKILDNSSDIPSEIAVNKHEFLFS